MLNEFSVVMNLGVIQQSINKQVFAQVDFIGYLQVLKKLMRFVCVEVLRTSKPNGVISSAISLRYHMFTGQA